MPEGVRRRKTINLMENDYLTAGDLALWETRRGYGNHPYECGCGCHKGGGKATTGIGLAAGLGGGALLLAIAGIWGINQASKARSEGNQNTINALTNNVNQLTNFAFAERVSRENWQLQHAPTITQFTSVAAGAGAGATSNATALAQAESNLLSGALTGEFCRCPREVTLVSKEFCRCPASNSCGCNC